MKEKCTFNLVCSRSNCKHFHDTQDGRSPEYGKCRYNQTCIRSDCQFLHDTLSGRPPGLEVDTFKEEEKGDSFEIRIFQWNVLSDILAQKMSPEFYPDHETVLDGDRRWTMIFTKLEEVMTSGHILCLQEVTRHRAENCLQAFCDLHVYTMIFRSHGNEFNGFMGNCILVPGHLLVERIHSVRPGKLIMKPVEGKGYPHLLTTVLLYSPSHRLRFFVTTYHMPCQYKRPEIMKSHLQVLYDLMKTAPYPVILCGDLNMTPEDVSPPPFLDSLWNHQKHFPTIHSHVHSAYRACIDHILFSSSIFSLVTTSLNSFTHYDKTFLSTERLMPNAIQPSDHIPLTACFQWNS